MREIKFKSWHKIDKRFLEEETIQNHVILVIPHGNNYELNQKLVIFLQYTGLKDKNGKEIYEGDIVVQITELKDATSIKNYRAKWTQGKGVITWDDEGADYNVVANNGQFISSFGLNNTTVEIIGNVYENPELINK